MNAEAATTGQHEGVEAAGTEDTAPAGTVGEDGAPVGTEAAEKAGRDPGSATEAADTGPGSDAATEPEQPAADGEAAGGETAGGETAGGETADGETADGDPGKSAGEEPSEAEQELAAQRELRERIARRKSEREAPIDAGGKLSGTAADLLAAVRAVESGERPVSAAFTEPAPPPRRHPSTAEHLPPRQREGASPAFSPEAVEAAAAVLAEGAAPAALAPAAAVTLGESVGDLLRTDPWQLLRIAGVRPDQADGFARRLLGDECSPTDSRRGRALTVWLLEQAAAAGHTALEGPQLAGALGKYGVPEPEARVEEALAAGDVLAFQDALPVQAGGQADRADTEAAGPAEDAADTEDAAEPPVRVLLGLERYALAEESLADALARLSASEIAPATQLEEAGGRGRGSSTAELLRAVASNGLVVHTGSWSARAEPAALVAAAHAAGLRVCAAVHAPSARAGFARLVAESADPGGDTGESLGLVTTVADLLSASAGPGRDADGAYALDLLVLLDAPRIDVEAAALLAEQLPDGARLVLSGDPADLWSAGPGRVFADVLAARCCPQVVSRTPDEGPIGSLVSAVGAGELPPVQGPGKEVVIVPVQNDGEAVHRTVQLVADSVPRTFSLTAADVQVIVPAPDGSAGSAALNAALKERLNPGPGRFGGFDPGDRVVRRAAHGAPVTGTVVGADAEGLRLDCAGTQVVVARQQVEEQVRHSWALTAEEAAGFRRPAVVVVLPPHCADKLTRAWVHTAFGVAERHLSVVHGVDQALAHAVVARPAKPRTTRLTDLLRRPEET